MSISINCQCGRTMLISEELEGLPVRCPNCGRKHLVPKYEPVPVAKPVMHEELIEISKPVCTNCKQDIDINARFCPNCGKRVISRKPVVKPVEKPVRIVKDIEKQIPNKPEIFPGPFGGRRQQQFGQQPQNTPFKNCGYDKKCMHKRREFVKHAMLNAKNEEIIKPETKTSGLAKFGFFTGFLSIVIALMAALVVVNKNAMPQQVSMHNVRISMGMMEIGMIFALIAGVSAILAVFHFSRRRFLLIFITLIFVFGTIGVAGKTMRCKSHFYKERIQRHYYLNVPMEDIPEDPMMDEQEVEELLREFSEGVEIEPKNLDDRDQQPKDEPQQEKEVEPKPKDDVKQKKASEDF